MVNRKLQIVFKVFISACFIGYLVNTVDWGSLFKAIKSVELILYLLSLLITLASTVIIAGKYHLLIKNTSIHLSIPSLIKINLISRFYALFLPSAIGPEAVRWYKVTKKRKGKTFFLVMILFERLTFLLSIVLFSLVPLIFYSKIPAFDTLKKGIVPIGLILLSTILISLFILTSEGARNKLFKRIDKMIPLQWKPGFEQVVSDGPLNRLSPRLFITTFSFSLLWQFFFIVRIFLLFISTGIPLHFFDVAWIGSMTLFLQILPISFAGIGVREGAYVYFLSYYSIPAEYGILLGILFFSQMLVLAGLGGLLELTGNSHQTTKIVQNTQRP